ncbi:MAG: PAS domain S-box protein [Gemmatimonadetes bacterium]|nr:PAS domain S-box protein [Gemmatimonadota bacterium]
MRWIGGKVIGAGLERAPALPNAHRLLQWVYVGRVLLAIVVFVAAAFYFRAQPPEVLLALATAAIASVIVSAGSAWYTHVLRAPPRQTFLYSQSLFDVALVTTIVHLTGGADSDFSALYILVIAVSAVLMPVTSGLLVTLLASLVYLADIVWWHPIQVSVRVGLQILVFLSVAVATGWLASRVSAVGAQREVLQKEVTRLRLGAGDILRNIRSGIVTVDGTGNLLYANPAAEELLGVALGPLVGRPLVEVLQARSPGLWAAIVATQRHGQGIVRSEGRMVVNGRSFPIGLTTTALEMEPGHDPSVTAIFVDITDQKRLEEMHLRTERLEAVAELSSSLAHEIKNPLASIRSSVEQLARSARANADERFLAHLVVRESDRLARLLTEFLDFSRVRVTHSRELDLLTVARAGADVVRRHPDCPPGTNIAVEGEVLRIEGDEDLLHRVVVNLVLNGVQAAGEGGRVRVCVRRARGVDIPPGVTLDDPVVVEVTDNGPGVAEEIRERVFDPFVSGRVGGSGLGLAIVQRAVQAHRGFVLFDSPAGRGTTFSVVLPGRAAQASAGA